MRSIVLILSLFAISETGIAQGTTSYEPITNVGWEVTNFSPPENLTETDSGEVKYLLKLNTKGRLTGIRVLSNTFTRNAEKMWRRQVRKAVFLRNAPIDKISYKGTFLIQREPCRSVK